MIWDYLNLHQEPRPAEVIIAAGTNDLRVAEFAADLYLRGYAPLLVMTGGMAHHGDLLATGWDKTEAEMYADVAERRGVPRDRILLEPRATNTAENIRFTRRLLEQRGSVPATAVFALKPFMQRRIRATLAVEWPELRATLGSPRMTLDEYFTADLTPEKIIHIMMGDLQRVWLYAARGWSAAQPLPAEVRDAYDQLKSLGFTRQLLPED